MTFTPIGFTGFEDGNIRYSIIGAVDASPSYAYSGGYGARINYYGGNSGMYFPIAPQQNDVYIGFRVYPNYTGSAGGRFDVVFYITDGNYLRLAFTGSSWNGYVNAGLVASGTVVVPGSWHHVQVHIKAADSGGIFECYLDGVQSFSYVGDTKPGAGTDFNNIRWYGVWSGAGSNSSLLDDIVVGTGGYPGEMRATILVPNADTPTVQWTPSTGLTNFGVVDEIPAADADYLSTGVTGQRSIMELSNFDASGKTPRAINLITRMNRSTVDPDTIKFGIISNGIEVTENQVISTTMNWYTKFFQLNPDGNVEWDDTALDALQVVLESVIA